MEGFTEVRVIEVFNRAPETVIRVSTLSKETVDMWIPLKGAAKGVKNTDKTGDEVLDLFREKKSSLITSETDSKRQFSRSRSSRKKCRKDSSMVKTRCLWVQLINLKDIAVDLSLEYFAPQVGQNLEWQRKGTNLRFPQWGQPYMTPP